MKDNVIIETKDLCKDFEIRQPLTERIAGHGKKTLSAVSNVNLAVYRGEALSIVGESGCGKSTLARVLMLLYNDYRGKLLFKGEDIRGKSRKWILNEYRSQVQMVFQDPYSCLNPRKTVRSTLREVLDVHGKGDPAERDGIISELLGKCGIAPDLMDKYPRELSGGQCQRIGIARALLLSPELLIADEPVSALDVSVQAQVINLLQDLREELDLTLIFISHDLSVVRYISDRIAVMYLGEIVEMGRTEELFTETLHPYTKLLLDSAPKIDTGDEHVSGTGTDAGLERNTDSRADSGSDQSADNESAQAADNGSNHSVDNVSEEKVTEAIELPNAIDVPSGCRFHTRCPHACDKCREEVPVLRDFGNGHMAACHFAGDIK